MFLHDGNNDYQKWKIGTGGTIESVLCKGMGIENQNTRYVKVSLSGHEQLLTLAEVEVFAMVNGAETNVALESMGATATQSSTYSNPSSPSSCCDANRAIDGNTGGNYPSDTVTSSVNPESNPWWMVDLKQSYEITRIVVWNRQDCCTDRLSGATVSLLDSSGAATKQFSIGDSTNKDSFTFEVDDVSWTVGEDTCLASTKDRALAKSAMHNCDASMSLLLGSQISVGTLKATADLITEKGPEYMPGYCCMDVATDSGKRKAQCAKAIVDTSIFPQKAHSYYLTITHFTEFFGYNVRARTELKYAFLSI